MKCRINVKHELLIGTQVRVESCQQRQGVKNERLKEERRERTLQERLMDDRRYKQLSCSVHPTLPFVSLSLLPFPFPFLAFSSVALTFFVVPYDVVQALLVVNQRWF